MSSGYQLPCRCGKITKVLKSQAGETVTCECGEKLQIPTLRGFAELQLFASEPAAKPTRGKWNPILGIPTALLFAVALMSLTYAAYVGFWRYQVQTTYQIQDEIEAGEKIFDAHQPAEILMVYRQFRTIGLEHKSPPSFYYNILVAKNMESNIRFYGLLGSGALLLGLVTTYLSRSRR